MGEVFMTSKAREGFLNYSRKRNHFRCQHWAAAKNGEKYGVQY